MRLLRLRIKNIASLKGEHEVDFTEIITQSPLFAITGETGSGKSSLLNSLGLVLYGQIYKKNVGQLDVVTLGEKDGSIELIFNVKGKYYLADWRAKVRKQNGEYYSTPQTPVRNLYVLEKPEFGAAKNISYLSTPELLNLDFDQFCKCVILNQGEFAKFLTSSFSERKDILEKLYPGELLESMGRELKSELEQLQKFRSDCEIELAALKGDGYSGASLKEQQQLREKEYTGASGISSFCENLAEQFLALSSGHHKWLETHHKVVSLKAEMSEETLRMNQFSVTANETRKKFEELCELQERERPRLQRLLKTEETLLNTQQQLTGLLGRSSLLENRRTELARKLTALDEKRQETEAQVLASRKNFTLPIAELISKREELEGFLELTQEREFLGEELKGKLELLSGLEESGKDLKGQLEAMRARLKLFPSDLVPRLKKLEEDRTAANLQAERKQRALINFQELSKTIQTTAVELETIHSRLSKLATTRSQLKEEKTPLLLTLKLQQIAGAIETCIVHGAATASAACPVCLGPVSATQWAELRSQLQLNDFARLKVLVEEIERQEITQEEEEKYLRAGATKLNEVLSSRRAQAAQLKGLSDLPVASVSEIEAQLQNLRQSSWEFDSAQKDEKRVDTDLTRSRMIFARHQQEMVVLKERHQDKTQRLEKLAEVLTPLLLAGGVLEPIITLKLELRQLRAYQELESSLQKLTAERAHAEELLGQLASDTALVSKELTQVKARCQQLQLEITQGLGTQKASELIASLNQKVKSLTDENSRLERDLKNHELRLRDFQGRLHNLSELEHDFELQFDQQAQRVRESATFKGQLPPELSTLAENLRSLDLELKSPRSLFIPICDFLTRKKEELRSVMSLARDDLTSVSARLADWEKKQEKITALEVRVTAYGQQLARKERLYEVLGKDELRTFVLSLVEENLIEQTNDELQKLCQGRYEIIHQSRRMKMTPEFYILDKYREGGIRKVSTLSGGETFMVSLAMALGLAELTRGQAEIDSLFIDEGFGTLDQESLEDVLDMLKQIQTRGLMVGIISHIKPLTDSLPINLLLSKRQDGTSKISTQYN
ncbi:MAG TPA: SMC family ATPase [Bacteriovoracaceae bacterium]|nr:SMC family ATPase [Bacteriovoracaceae bacterium]